MRLPRDILSDLVEKRLWPIAVLLVAALVAVPLVLAKSPAPAPGEPGTVPPAAQASVAGVTPAGEPVVSIGKVESAPLRGRPKNPFRQQHLPPKASLGGSSPVSGGASAGSGGGPAAPGGGTPAPTTPQKVYVRAAIDVRVGKAIGVKHTIEDVPRLTPLPNPSKPIAIFLGMRKDHETAVFMISSDVRAQGDGTCVPSRRDCQAIELKEGDVALLDLTAPDGRVTQYELQLVKVTLEQTTSKEAAQAAYARASRVGARILRHRAASARNTVAQPFRMPFRYASKTGVLHIAPWLSGRLRRLAEAEGSATSSQAVGGARDTRSP